MNDYWHNYYRTPGQKEYLDAAMSALETETAKSLKKYMQRKDNKED